jgi:N-acyl-D-amino-acid deacylase
VLGMLPARERTVVTEAELKQMQHLFYEGMKAGAFGFSLDKNMEDRPEDGSLLPSIVASDEEFCALAEVLGEFGVGHIGLTLGFGLTSDERQAVRALTAQMMRRSGRPFHLLDVQLGEDLAWLQSCRAAGLPLVLQLLCTPGGNNFKLSEYNLYDYMPNWVQPLVGSPEERAAKLRDPGVRAAMKRDVEEWPNLRTNWSRLRVLEVVHERHYQYEGLTITELADMTGKHPLDAFLDLALDEGLETEFRVPPRDTAEELQSKEQQLKDPYAHISVSDGGAHTRFSANSVWPVYWLSYWIRDREIMSLEQAHYKISAYPAWFADFKDRGTLRVGNWADIIVYKQEELGFVYAKPVYANDFPGGERRLVQKPTGLRYTIVNGTVTFEENNCTGALPGKLLRSYDMVR